MIEPLFELLAPYLDTKSPSSPSLKDQISTTYLNRLTTLPLSSLKNTESQALSQRSHSLLLSLQALSTHSHKSIISSFDHLSSLPSVLPALAKCTADLRDAIPKLDETTMHFSATYNKNAENSVLDRRKKALLLMYNADKIQDILDLPTLLSSAISSGSPGSINISSSSSATANYALALDLNAHTRRLHGIYPDSRFISSVALQAEVSMQAMATNLMLSLKTQGVKLAGAMRTISWLRRVAPELDAPAMKSGNNEGSLGALFLICRLANLMAMLDALEPLRELADQEISRNSTAPVKRDSSVAWFGGQQTERYLKRYIEIFREQSFAIISMFKSIFPATTEQDSVGSDRLQANDPLLPLPSALSSFPLHLTDMLSETLKRYLPNVQDRSSRDSLLTQILYCAGSLGRLGGDFSMILAILNEENEEKEDEWVEVVRKHRLLAGRLELMVGSKDG